MKKALFFSLLILSVYVAGCSTLPGPGGQERKDPFEEEKEDAEISGPAGMIFAKTDFQGIVKTSYVQLSIIDQADERKTYQLYIGDKARQKGLPWKVKTVKPGYFFIELPAGSYRIDSISIPVSTTVASEPMHITFDVQEDKIIYVGTLKIVGTKEKIRLGGMPLLKPGFEYTAELIDERREAFRELRQRFPDVRGNPQVRLMHIQQDSPEPAERKEKENP